MEAVEKFLDSFGLYFCLRNAPEDLKLAVASSRLKGAHEDGGFIQAQVPLSRCASRLRRVPGFSLRCRLTPRSARKQAVEEQSKHKQGKLSTGRYVEKYQSLVRRNPLVDRKRLYNGFIQRLSPGERLPAIFWAVDRRRGSQIVELTEMMEYRRIRERQKEREDTTSAGLWSCSGVKSCPKSTGLSYSLHFSGAQGPKGLRLLPKGGSLSWDAVQLAGASVANQRHMQPQSCHLCCIF